MKEFLIFLQNELEMTDTEEDVVEAFKVFILFLLFYSLLDTAFWLLLSNVLRGYNFSKKYPAIPVGPTSLIP